MRIAIIADIHGNDVALEAVLDEIEGNGGVDGYWILGDLVAIGPAPIKVLKTLQSLPNAQIVRGNTDRYICTGDRPGPTAEEVIAGYALLSQRIEIEGDFCWTQGAITTAGWFAWLSKLPLEFRTQLPDGTSVLCVHASPNQDEGSGIHQELNDGEIVSLISGCQEHLICVGHTHRPFSMRVENKHIINPGSVSNPVGSDKSACYAIIDSDENGYKVEFFRVIYNYQLVNDLLERIKHPARRFITDHFCGN